MQLNFDQEAEEISARINCPGCSRKQEEPPQCVICGLVIRELRESADSSKTGHVRRSALLVLILVAAGVLFASYGFISLGHASGEKPTIIAGSSYGGQRTTENDLRTIAKELSGDVGVVKSLTDGSTKGSFIAMVFFSVIGIGYFSYGKKSQQFVMVVCGIALMGYSYFVNGTIYIILIGVGLSALPFILGRR